MVELCADAGARARDNSTAIHKLMMTFLLILCEDGAYLLIGYAKLCASFLLLFFLLMSWLRSWMKELNSPNQRQCKRIQNEIVSNTSFMDCVWCMTCTHTHRECVDVLVASSLSHFASLLSVHIAISELITRAPYTNDVRDPCTIVHIHTWSINFFYSSSLWIVLYLCKRKMRWWNCTNRVVDIIRFFCITCT